MGKLFKNRIFLTLTSIALILLYLPINRFVHGGTNTGLAFDRLIPIIPFFIIPYLLGTVLFLTLPFIMMKFSDSKIFYPYIFTLIFAAFFSNLINIFFPTYVVRDKILPEDFFTYFIKLLYLNDNVNNAAPSGHTFFTIINLIFFIKLFPKFGLITLIISVLIISSTLFTGQHNIFDVLTGIGFAAIVTVFGLLIGKKLHS